MRTFDTGATRSPLANKPQYEGYLNPLVIKRFGEYMLKHQTQADGQRRDADNWQKGIPPESLMDSAWRHFEDVWLHHRGYPDAAVEPLEEALCAVMFNMMAMLLRELGQAQARWERSEIEEYEKTTVGCSCPDIDQTDSHCPLHGSGLGLVCTDSGRREAHVRGAIRSCAGCAPYYTPIAHSVICPNCGLTNIGQTRCYTCNADLTGQYEQTK